MNRRGVSRRQFFSISGAAMIAAQTATAADTRTAWKNGKRWVYSITYDEGCEDLLKYAYPIHQKFGIPGHVALVASQIGVPRNVPGSTYDGMMILNKQQCHDLAREGWGFSCHGLTHAAINGENAQKEVVEARKVIQDALEMPIDMFIVPNSNDSHPAAAKVAPEAGYTSVVTIYDRCNTLESDRWSLGRVPLHTRYPGPFFSEFDPYKRIHQAIDIGGWIIDYCHCPMPDKPTDPAKDCTTQELEQRFETVKRIGGDDVWLAEPTEVVRWLLAE